MMNPEFNDDHPPLTSEYYPVGLISHFVTDQQGAAAAGEKVKARRRRRKGKGGGEGLMRKRKLSEEQLSMLERSFGSEHKLETERKDQLAAELGLDPRQVAVWFQNRRARWKTKKLEEEFSKLRSHHESTVLEKCRLQTEIMKMKAQLEEAEKEIQRLSEERGEERVRSNSPTSSLSTEANNVVELHHEQQYGMMGYFDNVFYVPETNYGANVFPCWDDHLYYV